MSQTVFVGVDSGGTRTNVELVVCQGESEQHLPSYEVLTSLSGTLERDLIPDVLSHIFAPLDIRLSDANIRDARVNIWISAAGYSPWVRDTYVSALDKMRPSIASGLVDSIGIGNDAVSILMGSQADGAIIAGTGSNSLFRSSTGLHQAGGRDWVASDYGSGIWIGLRAIRQAYRDFESGLDSVLLQRLHQVYGVRQGDADALIAKLRDLAVADQHMKREIARFAESVCGAAERGDPGAQNIVKAEAEDLADVTAGSIRRFFNAEEVDKGLTLVQCGSLLANSFYRTSFEAQLEMRLLSGVDHRAEIDWRRMVTGAAMSLEMAKDLTVRAKEIVALDLAFRPAIIA